MREITGRQTEILIFIEKFIADNGYSPTVREIGEHFRISPKGAYDHIIALQNKGYVDWKNQKPRTIRIKAKKGGCEA